MQLEVWGSAVSSHNGLNGGAPAENEFGAFYPYKMTLIGRYFTTFPDSYCNVLPA